MAAACDGAGGHTGSDDDTSDTDDIDELREATGFTDAFVDWSLPDAGLSHGFYRTSQDATSGGRWTTMDMDGDGRPDLVMTTGQSDELFGTAADQRWNVYMNTGSGFEPSPTAWNVPSAGLSYGFYRTAQDHTAGGRWATKDMNGDGPPDLVLTTDEADSLFGSPTAQRWRVYRAE